MYFFVDLCVSTGIVHQKCVVHVKNIPQKLWIKFLSNESSQIILEPVFHLKKIFFYFSVFIWNAGV